MKKFTMKTFRKWQNKEKNKDLNQENLIVCYACDGLGLSKGSIRRTSTISCANRLRAVEFDVCEICKGKKLIPENKD